ncbi:hypothetical protein CesoFtcFv8_008120 [Champsocephalus esox]|uniref:Uncharacterized protein n=1 Tax=Champsocephalus esox TaxID=159716 RepID=A0AAN8CFQ1_9TELE|nr:hypothetical protein CesoFtcFv8_008120 [Champsocephalus esox]
MFEKAVSTALKENLWKCSEKTRSTAVKRKTKKRVKQFSTDSEMNTSSMSEEFETVVGSTPLPQKKNKKKCILCHTVDCVTKFFRKVTESKLDDWVNDVKEWAEGKGGYGAVV